VKGIWKRKGMNCDSERLNFELDWKGLKIYQREFNKENKYNSMYQNMKFKIKNVYLVKDDTLLFVYDYKDSKKIVRYNCISDYNSWFEVKDAWSGLEY